MATASVRYIVDDVDAAIAFYCGQLEVEDLVTAAGALRDAGVHLRNDIVTGVGGKQILIDDPSGNPIELFQPTRPEASLSTRG